MAARAPRESPPLDRNAGPPVLLLAGEDEERLAGAVRRLIESVPEEERAGAVDRYEAAELARALDAARTPALIGGRRIVLAETGTALAPGGDAEARERLEQHLTRFGGGSRSGAMLVLIARKLDRRLRLVKELERSGALLLFERPREREMPRWIATEAERRGLALAPAAIQAIADAVGSDTGLAARELDKLALAAAPGSGRRRVTASDVEELLRPGRAVGAFALEDALLAGRAREALEALERHLAGAGVSAGPALLGRLAAVARRLTVARGVIDRGGGEDDVREALAAHPFVAKKYAAAARRIGERGVRALAAAVVADGMLKSGRDARSALVPVVLAFTGAPSSAR